MANEVVEKHEWAGKPGIAKLNAAVVDTPYRTVEDRIFDFKDVHTGFASIDDLLEQAVRCGCLSSMCGEGCPVGRKPYTAMPTTAAGQLHAAFLQMAEATPIMVTGDLCPDDAPCQTSCTAQGYDSIKKAVMIRAVERALADLAIANGWFDPLFEPNPNKNGKSIAIVGSGPAGLSAAYEAMKQGYEVTIYEKADKAGGLLRFGIPDFKYPKNKLDEYVRLLEKMGANFVYNTEIGKDITHDELKLQNDAVILAVGVAQNPMKLKSHPQESVEGLYMAMDYLTAQNAAVARQEISEHYLRGKTVIIVGAGDTASDCIGTYVRQNADASNIAESSAGLIRLDRQPQRSIRTIGSSYPANSDEFALSSSEKEMKDTGGKTLYQTGPAGREVVIENGKVVGIEVADFITPPEQANLPKHARKPVAENLRVIPCDVVVFALGFNGPHGNVALSDAGVEVPETYARVGFDSNRTNTPGVYIAGDAAKGRDAWLIVHALRSGKDAVNRFARDNAREPDLTREQRYADGDYWQQCRADIAPMYTADLATIRAKLAVRSSQEAG